MAIRKAVKFALNCRGDGSATEFEFLLSATPFWYEPPAGGDVLGPTFNLGSLAPQDVVDVTTTGPTVSSAELTTFNTKLKVVFASAPGNGPFSVFGMFLF